VPYVSDSLDVIEHICLGLARRKVMDKPLSIAGLVIGSARIIP
jgi:hypothetical protein